MVGGDEGRTLGDGSSWAGLTGLPGLRAVWLSYDQKASCGRALPVGPGGALPRRGKLSVVSGGMARRCFAAGLERLLACVREETRARPFGDDVAIWSPLSSVPVARPLHSVCSLRAGVREASPAAQRRGPCPPGRCGAWTPVPRSPAAGSLCFPYSQEDLGAFPGPGGDRL